MAISHLGHAEILVPDLDASAEFFGGIFGLQVSERRDDQVLLRAWQDFDHHTLMLTRSQTAGLGHMAWRLPERADVEAMERTLNGAGTETTWIEGSDEHAHGDALRFNTPGGLPFELYFEVKPYAAPADKASRLASHPSKMTMYGAAPRRFDHCTFIVDDVVGEQEWLSSVLGIRHNYLIHGPDGTRWGSWLSCNNVSHEIALTKSFDQSGGRLHHVAYYADSPDEVLRAASLLVDYGYELEWGPGKHGTSGATFLYFKEPSGNRVEIWTGGMLIFAPDWEPIRWDTEIGQLGNSMWGTPLPDTFRFGTGLSELAGALAG